MAYTRCANEFNSTPFTSCCDVASFGKHCDRCGEEITFHQDSAIVKRAKQLNKQGRCGICGKPTGNPAISGNCYC